MVSASSSPTTAGSNTLTWVGCGVILAAAAVAFIASKMNNKPKSADKVFDPIRSAAMMYNGVFSDDPDEYDCVINSTARFDSMPSKDKIVAIFKEFLLPHQQFHCYPETVPKESANIVWTPVKNLNVESQLFFEHQTENEFQTNTLVTDIINQTNVMRKQPKLPFWRVHLISEGAGAGEKKNKKQQQQQEGEGGAEGKEGENSSSATAASAASAAAAAAGGGGNAAEGGGPGLMVIQIHHCMADGVSLLTVFSKILSSDSKGTQMDATAYAPSKRAEDAGRVSSLFEGMLFKPWMWPVALVRFGDVLATMFETLMCPLGKCDTNSPFVPCSGGGKRAWPKTEKSIVVPMPTHSLALIKKIKNAAGKGVTVNDVEFSLYAGTMRRYLMKYCGWTSNQLDSALFRAMTPFAIPHSVKPEQVFTHTMGNMFTFIMNKLPVANRSARERVLTANQSWKPIKTRSYIPSAFFLTWLGSLLPMQAQRQTARDLFTKMSVVFSNLAGPAEELYCCGSKITHLGSLYSNILPQVIIVSMGKENPQLYYSLVMCQMGKVGTESDNRIALPKLFKEELDELCQQLNVTE